MKRVLLTLAVITAALFAQAQKIKVVDTDGIPVSYATIMTTQAEMIGNTDLEGVFEVNDVQDIIITHVAFKTKEVKLSGQDQTITLEDADYNMPEITVSPKPFVYVQTYYRMYYYSEEDGIAYYRAGLTDNVYDVAKKKVTASTTHISKAKYGLLKTLLGFLGGVFDKQSQISAKKVENRMLSWGEPVNLAITPLSPGKKRISDFKGTVGYITDDMTDHQRRIAYDSNLIYLHLLEAKGDAKALAKKEKRNERKKNLNDVDFFLYHIDDDGNYAPEDFISMQYLTSYDEVKKDGSTNHVIMSLQVFSTDRDYVTKDELKQRKKDNKMKMTYANILHFEREHNIPPLAPVVKKKLDELWKIKE